MHSNKICTCKSRIRTSKPCHLRGNFWKTPLAIGSDSSEELGKENGPYPRKDASLLMTREDTCDWQKSVRS